MFDVENKDSRPEKKRNRITLGSDQKRNIIIIGTIAIIVFILTFAYISSNNNNYNYLKQNKGDYLVYTSYQQKIGNYNQEIPYVNVESDIIDKVNEDIDLFTSKYKDKDKNDISYEYNINGEILSLLVKISSYEGDIPKVYFSSYNIDLKNRTLIGNKALLDLFNISSNEVSSKIETRFKKYYKDIVSDEYYTEDECDYNCFLSYRGVDNYLDNVSYYINNGNLYAYKSFDFYSIFGEEDYFKDKDFRFLLVKTDKGGK